MIDEGRPSHFPQVFTRAVSHAALVGTILATTLLVGCQEQQDNERQAQAGFNVEAPEVSVGDPLRGELSSASQINLKDGSRRDQHWLCPSAGNAAVGALYRLDAPFEGTISIFDESGEWLGRAESTDELPAELLVAQLEACSLVVVSGQDMTDFGPYALEPVANDAGTELADGLTVAGRLGEQNNSYPFRVDEASRVTLTLTGVGDATLDLSGTDVMATGKLCGDARYTLVAFLEAGDYEVSVVPGRPSREDADLECSDNIASLGDGYRLHMAQATLSRGERNSGPLRGGDRISGVLGEATTAGGTKTNGYSLSIEEPTRIELALSSSTFDTVLDVRGEQTSLHSDDVGEGSDSRIDSILMPGEYRVDVSSYGGVSGGYALRLTTTPFDGELHNGGELYVGQSTLGNLLASSSNTYQFTIDQVSMVTVDMASPVLDTVLELSGNNTQLSNDDFGSGDDSQIRAVLEPGTYEVAASSYDGSASGTYTLTLSAEPFTGEIQSEGEVRVGESIHGQLESGGVLTYRLMLAEQRNISVETRSSTVDTLLRLDGDGVHYENDDGGSTRFGSMIEAVLSPGTYTIMVSAYDGSGGLVQLDVKG